jgi:polar amino acid transport system substrate-binding protein
LRKSLLAITLLGTVLAAPAYSQTASPSAPAAPGERQELRVVVAVVPPFVMEQNGNLTGFSIDLWNAIAARLKVTTSYHLMPNTSGIEGVMQSKSADLTVVPVFITSARDEIFDFSYPIMDTGLQIMVRDTGQGTRTASPLWDVLRLLFSRTTMEWLGIALLLVLIPAHLVWWFERQKGEGGMLSDRKYFPGIFQAFYWAISTLTGSPEGMPHQWVARTFSIFWIFAGVVFVAFYTAQLTTTLTVEQIRGAIEGPADLPGKQVATIARSTGVDYLSDQNVQMQEYSIPDEMFKALLDKKVDAVVFSAPVLLYYAAHAGKGRVKVVGPEFNSAPIAITFQLDSPWRRKVDRALLSLRENGTYRQIYDRWFGTPQ